MTAAEPIARAKAAEDEDPEAALGLWAAAAEAEGLTIPGEVGWDRRPKAFGAPRRRTQVPKDLAEWVAEAGLTEMVALIDDLSRLVDFQTGLRLQDALDAADGRDDAALARAYLSMRLHWRAQAYAEALADARRVFDMAGDAEGLAACFPPGTVFEAEAVRLRAGLILGEAIEGFSEITRSARPLAVAVAELSARWRAAPDEGRVLADRLALTDDPPPSAEVLSAWLRGVEGDLAGGLAVARGLLLRRAERGDAAPPELVMAGAQLLHRLGDAEARQSWIERYFAYFNLDPPCWRAGGTAFDALETGAFDASSEGPLVTVAMTTFDASATLDLALRSLMHQSHRKLEILVVDDASTDDTLERLHALARVDSRIRVIESAENRGTYVCKNRALEQARGLYFTCLDADDWAHPRRIQRHVGTMQAHPRLVATRSNWIRMAEDGEPALRRSLGVFTHANPASPFYRTAEVREAVGYYDRVRIDGDLEHWLRLTTRFGLGATARLRLPLTLGRLHGASLTRSGVGAQNDDAYSPVRSAYRAAALAWRRTALREGSLYLSANPPTRPFPAPEEMLA